MGEEAVTNDRWARYLDRLREEHGPLDLSRVDVRFIPYFRNGQRIKVELGNGEHVTGKVTCEGGQRPVLVLQERSVSAQEPHPLTAKTELVGVRTGRGYPAPKEES